MLRSLFLIFSLCVTLILSANAQLRAQYEISSTQAHLISMAKQGHPSHPIDHLAKNSSHKHRHSDQEPEHEHTAPPPSLLEASSVQSDLPNMEVLILDHSDFSIRQAFSGDPTPLCPNLATIHRPPIA